MMIAPRRLSKSGIDLTHSWSELPVKYKLGMLSHRICRDLAEANGVPHHTLWWLLQRQNDWSLQTGEAQDWQWVHSVQLPFHRTLQGFVKEDSEYLCLQIEGTNRGHGFWCSIWGPLQRSGGQISKSCGWGGLTLAHFKILSGSPGLQTRGGGY